MGGWRRARHPAEAAHRGSAGGLRGCAPRGAGRDTSRRRTSGSLAVSPDLSPLPAPRADGPRPVDGHKAFLHRVHPRRYVGRAEQPLAERTGVAGVQARALRIRTVPGAVAPGDLQAVGLVSAQVFILGDATRAGADGLVAFNAMRMRRAESPAAILARVLGRLTATPEPAPEPTRRCGHRSALTPVV